MFCKNCGSKLDDDAIFCTNCGKKLSDIFTAKYCVACGVKLDDDAVFCSNCGYKVHEEKVNNDITDEKPFSNESSIDEETQEKFEDADENEIVIDRTPKINGNFSGEISADNKENDKLVHKVAITILAIVFLGIIIASIVQNHKQTSLTPWVSNATFSFDIYNSYTFNHYNAYEDDDYEFDCYKLSSKVISEISKNPPQYFIYNQKKYEVDNVNLDYFEVDLAHEDEDLVEDLGITNKILKEYNAIIFWNDYDGKYHHFDSVMILDGTEGFILYKYIDFSNFNY